MNLKSLTDEALLSNILGLVREERKLTIQVLHHLLEIERRMLFAQRGHTSLFEYCVSELGYTRSAAQRRIDSMRLMRQVPEVEARIADGSFSLTHLADAQSFFRKEEIRDAEQKKDVIERLVGQSVLEAQRTLMSLTDQPERHIPERTRVVSAELTEVRFVVDQATLVKLEELKALLSHARPGMGVKETLEYGLELALAKHRVKAQKSLVPAPVPNAGRASNARVKIPAAVRRLIYQRDGGVCTYQDAVTGRRCGDRRFLELDHLLPVARGGTDAPGNLRLRCRAHNQLHRAGPRHRQVGRPPAGVALRRKPRFRATLNP
jgi:5-methylcytosine-specific restriction endonuclease McrA